MKRGQYWWAKLLKARAEDKAQMRAIDNLCYDNVNMKSCLREIADKMEVEIEKALLDNPKGIQFVCVELRSSLVLPIRKLVARDWLRTGELI